MEDLPNSSSFEDKLDHIHKLIQATYNNLEKISALVKRLEQDKEKEKYKNVPGVEGTFDGVVMISEDGKKFEVPANYAAKSRLVFGDKLKLIEEEGKKIFKQIEKVERKKIQGILTKKEGKWYILADSGSYKISDVAAEFNHAELNDEAMAIIPAANHTAAYAALDMVLNKQPVEQTQPPKPVKPKPTPTAQHTSTAPPKKDVSPVAKVAAPQRATPTTKPVQTAKVEKPVEVKPKTKSVDVTQDINKEFVSDLTKQKVEDDDLR
jgi:hypothetical protein